MAKSKRKSGNLGSLQNQYHKDSVDYMLSKTGGRVPSGKEATALDQEWAASRTREFAVGQGIDHQINYEALMQEVPGKAPSTSSKTKKEIAKTGEEQGREAQAQEPYLADNIYKNDLGYVNRAPN
jgi:hypothetical protein